MAASRDKVAIVAGARSPVGRFGGAFKDTPAHDLGAAATVEALRHSGVSGDRGGEVVIGNIGQAAGDAYISRRIALSAGLDVNTPAFTVNRLCGSGLQAIWSAAQELLWGGIDVAVAGGAENMTRMPFYDFNARFNDRLGDRQAAFAEEIVAVTTSGRKPVEASRDEHPWPDTTLETLARLSPAFTSGGMVTAGNASGINDGGHGADARSGCARRGRSGACHAGSGDHRGIRT